MDSLAARLLRACLDRLVRAELGKPAVLAKPKPLLCSVSGSSMSLFFVITIVTFVTIVAFAAHSMCMSDKCYFL